MDKCRSLHGRVDLEAAHARRPGRAQRQLLPLPLHPPPHRRLLPAPSSKHKPVSQELQSRLSFMGDMPSILRRSHSVH